MKNRSAFLYKPYDLRVEERDIGGIRDDQVLIKMKACGICGSDVECYEGKSKEGRYDIAPYAPGHEWAGQAVEVGSQVINIAKGNKVTGDCVLPCGKCINCKNGLMPSACLNMREVGFRPDSPGGMAEYMVLEGQYIHPFPDEWSFDEGALIENFSVGYFGIWGNGGFVDARDRVIIMGGGPIGLSALAVAKAAHAYVIIVEPLPARQKLAIEYGADTVINPDDPDYVKQILDLTHGGGNLIVEASGNDKAIASVFDIAGHSARVRLIGHSVGRKIPIEIGKTIWKTLNIAGAGGTKDFMPRSIEFMDRIRKTHNFSRVITHKFDFKNIKDAFKKACEDKANSIKVMLYMQ
ncbi:MAG: zinc-binding dehydrogenase [Spirochaetia bacterium]